MGALGTRHSPAPSGAERFMQRPGRIAPRECGVALVVIARSEATKQSILCGAKLDCFASLAMTISNSPSSLRTPCVRRDDERVGSGEGHPPTQNLNAPSGSGRGDAL